MNHKLIAAGLCLSGFLSHNTIAQTTDYGEGMQPLEPSRLLANADGRYDHWTGVGHIESLRNRLCTAVLIDTRENPDIDAAQTPAYVLTSGHCAFTHIGMLGIDLEIQGQVEFNYFKDTANQRKVYPLKRLNWSSQQGTDLALLELQAPLSDLIDNNIQPLRLSQTPARVGSEILAVSAPMTSTGYTLRMAACTIDAIVDIVEQPFAWRNNLRNRCADVLPGSSGGATLDRYSNEVVGIMGTTTRNAKPVSRCFADSPCEIEEARPVWLPDTNYASPVSMLNRCFANGVFRPDLAACEMLPASVVSVANPNYLKHYIRLEHDDEGNVVPAMWDMKFAINTSAYVFKTTENPRHCQVPHGYSERITAKDAHVQAPIGSQPGIYTLCIVGVDDGREITPAEYNNAFIHTVELFEEAPVAEPAVQINLLPTGRHQIVFRRALPGNDGHQYKFGPPEQTDCDSPQGYKNVYTVPSIGPRLLPVKLCSKAINAAGELSAPRTDLLTAPENG